VGGAGAVDSLLHLCIPSPLSPIALHPLGFAIFEFIQQALQPNVWISTTKYHTLLSDSESLAQALRHIPASVPRIRPTPRQRIGSAYRHSVAKATTFEIVIKRRAVNNHTAPFCVCDTLRFASSNRSQGGHPPDKLPHQP
jgi:hypothetical protein